MPFRLRCSGDRSPNTGHRTGAPVRPYRHTGPASAPFSCEERGPASVVLHEPDDARLETDGVGHGEPGTGLLHTTLEDTRVLAGRVGWVSRGGPEATSVSPPVPARTTSCRSRPPPGPSLLQSLERPQQECPVQVAEQVVEAVRPSRPSSSSDASQAKLHRVPVPRVRPVLHRIVCCIPLKPDLKADHLFSHLATATSTLPTNRPPAGP